jgi:glyoxylase-like metal-dependent hydrolase (beta-lactamase superfamily II)/rhodanese-related sulfurtransferase
MSASEDPMTRTEVTAAELESEIRTGAPITILDVRDRATFDDWHIEPAGATLINVPLAELERDPVAAVAAAAREPYALRVLCTRGRTSDAATGLLRDAGVDAMSVTGGMIAWSRLLAADIVTVPSAAAIVQFRREARGCLSYLIASGGEALVVDPAPDVEPYVAEAARRGARITHVLDTHVHADHLSGLRRLAAATGAKLHLSTGALARGADAAGVATVHDGDRIPLGDADVRVIGLPGHTTDNVGVVIDGVAVIAGDSLFVDSVARPDLEVGDTGAAGAARLLHRTLHERLLPLGDDVVLLPCHYGGGRRTAPVVATLGEVRATTPLVDLNADAFVTEVLAAMPPRPQNYLEIIAANLAPVVGGDDDVAGLEVGANNCAATIVGS